MSYRRYDIHWVDLDPVRGSELAKTRPAVVISMDVLNRALETVVIGSLSRADAAALRQLICEMYGHE